MYHKKSGVNRHGFTHRLFLAVQVVNPPYRFSIADFSQIALCGELVCILHLLITLVIIS